MEIINVVSILVSSISFLGYGIMLLRSEEMQIEFKRFKLEKLMVLTGVLEILGGLGLLVGFYIDIILLLSSGGLSALMFFAFLVRIKMRDSVLVSLPSLFFMILNFFIFYYNLDLDRGWGYFKVL